MKQIDFAITGFQKQAQQASNSTGLRLGEIGVDLQKNAVARLCESSPQETNKNLEVALMQRYGLCKTLRASVLVGEPDFALVPVRSDFSFQAAYDAVMLAMLPAPDELIIAALSVIEAKCKRGKESDEAGSFSLKVFVSELRSYPADVVLSVLKAWGDQNIFAPSWHELKVKLDAAQQKRRDLIFAIEWSSKQKKQALSPKPAPVDKVDFMPAPDLQLDPRPPLRSAQAMSEALRGLAG